MSTCPNAERSAVDYTGASRHTQYVITPAVVGGVDRTLRIDSYELPRANNEAETGGTYGRDPGTEEILGIVGHAPENLWIFDALLHVSYEVDLFGRVRRSVEAARADAAVIAAARDAVRITVPAETARAYAQICALGERLAVAHRSLDIVSHEAEITVQRHDAGANSNLSSSGLKAWSHRYARPFRHLKDSANPPCSNWQRCWAAHRRVLRLRLTGFYGGVATSFDALSTNVARASGIGLSIS